MNILIFNNISNASVYGVGTYLKQVIGGLKDLSAINLSIVNLYSLSKSTEIKCIDGVRHINIPKPQNTIFSDDNYQEKYYRNVFYLLSLIITKENIDIFHFNYVDQLILGKFIKQKYIDSKIVLTIHYIDWLVIFKGNSKKYDSFLNKNIDNMNILEVKIYNKFLKEKILLNESVDNIICLSNTTKNVLISQYGVNKSKIHCIKNGLKNESKRIIKRFELGDFLAINKESTILIYVGRISETKGVNLLIKGFKEALKINQNLHLLIVGGGDLEIYMKEIFGLWHKITFTGKLAKEEVYNLYSISNIGVIPTYGEQCSYVAIEMMMFGLPIIGTESIGLNEMITNKNSIRINIDNSDENLSIEALTNAILEMASKKLADMQMYSKYYFLQKYNLSKMINKLLALYNTH